MDTLVVCSDSAYLTTVSMDMFSLARSLHKVMGQTICIHTWSVLTSMVSLALFKDTTRKGLPCMLIQLFYSLSLLNRDIDWSLHTIAPA